VSQINDLLSDTSAYFAQLNQTEMYCWIAEAAGFMLIIVGLVLWI
jgi:hypothetical protein